MKLEFNYNLWYNDETQSTEIAFFLGDNSAEACVSIPLHSLILDTITSEIEYAKNNSVKKISLTEVGNLVNVDLGLDVEEEQELVVKVKKTKKSQEAKVEPVVEKVEPVVEKVEAKKSKKKN